MPTFTTSTHTYHYRVAGNGPPLLLLHGFTGSSNNWAGLMDALGSEYTLIALDLPGHGRTMDRDPLPDEAYTMPAVARDIAALLEHLGLASVHLLGYSMGGRLALYLALKHPERWSTLILESASPGLRDAQAREERVAQDEALAQFIEREGMRAFVDRWEALPLFASQQQLPDEVCRAHRAGRLRNRPAGLARSLRRMGTGVQPSLWEQLPRLTLPTLLIAGDLDHKFVGIAHEMAALMPQAELAILPHAGHTVHLEQPEAYAQRLRRWLANT
ncbi:MAG TPA: 2-succinyl-6-hydroxy-2,4-cyclohexadiene-1-carboxylate synthase [Candidatus Sulfomarinibacteraceae bacterium]|nr:2-succinyl-6-hydroxy-2,4-cyclohexadiene-1-carboxylate synthase [Candidatus Sulfomarinibacteraceae bacterium]